MSRMSRKLLIELFALPVIVGIIVSAVQFGLPLLARERLELSYSIEEPVTFFTRGSVEDLDIQVNNREASELHALKVHIWNSGKLPLENITVCIILDPMREDFCVFSVTHETKPEYEFGKIDEGIHEKEGNKLLKRFVYELLNRGDQDGITFLTNALSSMSIFAKHPALKVKCVQMARRGGTTLGSYPILVAALGSLLSVLIIAFTIRVRYRARAEAMRMLDSGYIDREFLSRLERKLPHFMSEEESTSEKKTNT